MARFSVRTPPCIGGEKLMKQERLFQECLLNDSSRNLWVDKGCTNVRERQFNKTFYICEGGRLNQRYTLFKDVPPLKTMWSAKGSEKTICKMVVTHKSFSTACGGIIFLPATFCKAAICSSLVSSLQFVMILLSLLVHSIISESIEA